MTDRNPDIQMAPLPSERAPSYSDGKKGSDGEVEVGVVGVYEPEDVEYQGRPKHYVYENIPEGIDLSLIHEEKVVRGLSERHIQVSPYRALDRFARPVPAFQEACWNDC
jgi:hypothetical protein